MGLPIAPYPPAELRLLIDGAQWETCQQSWIQLLRRVLRQSEKGFVSELAQDAAMVNFLSSYVDAFAAAAANGQASKPKDAPSRSLRRNVFRTIHRLLSLPTAGSLPTRLVQPDFLVKLSLVFHNAEVRSLIETLHRDKKAVSEASLSAFRDSIVSSIEAIEGLGLDAADVRELVIRLRGLAVAVMLYPDFAESFILGSDFMSAISTLSGYKSGDAGHRYEVLSNHAEYLAYVLFTAMGNASSPKYSALLDQLFDLVEMSSAANLKKRLFVTDLVSRTPLLKRLEQSIGAKASARSNKVFEKLRGFRDPALSQLDVQQLGSHRQLRLKKESRMKKRGGATAGDPGSLRDGIKQLRDLFPDMDTGSAERMLSEHDFDVELVTSMLLDDFTLAQNYKNPDPSYRTTAAIDDLNSSGLPTGRLHVGRKGEIATADTMLDDRTQAPSKKDILAALAAIDSDDDERDDTYDADDVGGFVDGGAAGEQNAEGDDREDMLLYHAFVTTPSVFERNATMRRSKERVALKQTTGLTDESIEGWKIMLERDKRRQSRLESRYNVYSREQSNILAIDSDGPTEVPQSHNTQRGGGGNRRGKGGGGGDRSGTAGNDQEQKKKGGKPQSSKSSSQANRRRKAQRFKKAGGNPME